MSPLVCFIFGHRPYFTDERGEYCRRCFMSRPPMFLSLLDRLAQRWEAWLSVAVLVIAVWVILR